MGTRIYSQNQGVRRHEPKLLEILVITLLFIVGLWYSVTAFSAGDPLWFMPSEMNARPTVIEIYHDGEKVLLSPDDPVYDALTEELDEQIQHVRGYYEHGFPPRALEAAKARSTVVIMHYDETLRLRTRWNLGTPNRLLVPITGSNSGKNRIYTGTGDRYGHGALILEDLSAFTTTVKEYLDDSK